MTTTEIEIVRQALNRAFIERFGAAIYRPEDGALVAVAIKSLDAHRAKQKRPLPARGEKGPG